MSEAQAPKLRQLTPGQEIISSAFIEGKPITQEVADEAGYSSPETARAALKSPTVRAHLSSYLDEAGATLQKSARVIAEAHDAKKTHFFAFEGKVRDEKETIDHGTRMDAAELNLKARGELKDGVNLTFNVYENMSDAELAKIALGEAAPPLPGGIIEGEKI